MKLLMLVRRKNIILGADTIKEEFPEEMKIDLYSEGHVGQKKRKEYPSCASKPKVYFHGNHVKTFSKCQSPQNIY